VCVPKYVSKEFMSKHRSIFQYEHCVLMKEGSNDVTVGKSSNIFTINKQWLLVFLGQSVIYILCACVFAMFCIKMFVNFCMFCTLV